LVTMIVGSAVTILVIISAPYITDSVLMRPELRSEMYLAAVAIFFQVSFTYRSGALQGFGAFQELGKANAISGLLGIGIMYFAVAKGGLEGALLGNIVINAIRSFAYTLNLRAVKKRYEIPKEAGTRTQDYHNLWYLALPAALAGLVTIPALWIVNLNISKLPDGLQLVGIFSIAHQLRQAVLYLPTLLNSVSFSVMSRLLSAKSYDHARSVFLANLSISIAFATVVALLLASLAQPVMNAYTINSTEGAAVLSILAISIIPELAAISIYQLIQSSGLLWRSLIQIAIPRGFMLCALSLLTLPHFGLLGAAAAYLIAHCLGLAATLLTARQAVGRIIHDE
jgi:O-antigen/teichoic acid export membrane protein